MQQVVPNPVKNDMVKMRSVRKAITKYAIGGICLLLIMACSTTKTDSNDAKRDKSKAKKEKKVDASDFAKMSTPALMRELRGSQTSVSSSIAEPDIPKLTKLLIPPLPPQIQGDKLISFSVTEDVSIKDVLIEIGRMADVDVQVDKNISGGIILKVKRKPLKIVLDRICRLANLKYSFEDGILSFERDLPYRANYVLDFIPDGDLWSSVQSSVEEILELLASEDSVTANSMVAGAMVNNLMPNEDGSFMDGGIAAPMDAGTGSEIMGSKVIINKPANLLTVFANSKAQRAIAEYLEEVRRNASAQVLIEVKMVEVSLDQNSQNGIDWTWMNGVTVSGGGSGGGASGGDAGDGGSSGSGDKFVGDSVIMNPATGLAVSIAAKKLAGGTIEGAVSLLQSFGKTRTLSSPRIHAINNQESTFSFVDKEVYFEVEVDNTTTGEGETLVDNNITSTKQEVDVGVTLNINPTINLEKREVTLKVEPEMTVISGWKDDPATTGTGAVSQVPIIQSRKITTTMKLKDGEVMVIGGLMKDAITHTESGVPVLQHLPLLGYLFRKDTVTSNLVETVIFIKATIIDTPAAKNALDSRSRNFYNKHSGDRI